MTTQYQFNVQSINQNNMPSLTLCSFIAVAIAASCNACENLPQPTFQVISPNELMITHEKNQELELITFRIGVKRKNSEFEDLEMGENSVSNNVILFYNKKLALEQGDSVNYLVAYKDKQGYCAKTGTYVFSGVYAKTSRRLKRFASLLKYSSSEEEEGEGKVSTESRFGGHHHHGFWPNFHHGRNPFNHQHGNFKPWDTEPFHFSSEEKLKDFCMRKFLSQVTTTTSSTEYPQIDVRFSDNEKLVTDRD